MDDGRGRFAQISEEVSDQVREAAGDKEDVPIFIVGETLLVRGASFKVLNLDAFTGIATFKLLPRNGIESLKHSIREHSEGN